MSAPGGGWSGWRGAGLGGSGLGGSGLGGSGLGGGGGIPAYTEADPPCEQNDRQV